MSGCWARVFTVLMVYGEHFGHAEMIENPAIAAKCRKMAQKRVNGVWQTTHFSSNCDTDSEEEAARLCKKAFPSLFVTGVRPNGAQKIQGPWCQETHEDWNRPCKGKPHLAKVYECLTREVATIEPERDSEINMRKEIIHERQVPKKIDSYSFQDFDINRGDEFDSKSTTTISTTTTTLTTTTTGTTAAPTTSVLAVEWETTAEVEEEIPTGPPALAVPPMCSFRHTQRIENETCKDAAGWRTDAQRTCAEMNFKLHSFAPLSTCADGDLYLGLQFVCCPNESIELTTPKIENKDVNAEVVAPVAMAIKASNQDIQVSRVELRSSPSVAAAAVAVGAAVVLLLTALAVITVRGRQRVRRERRLANQRTPLSPEERHLQRLQSTGYENPTYRFFEQRQ